jgi:hypothetical protein
MMEESQVIVLKNHDYLIAMVEEREETPECLLTNPYRILDLSYWDYSNRDKKHVPQEGAVFVKQSEETEINETNGEQVITVQTDYIILEKFPNYTDQTQIYLRADDILTICDPTELVLECYKKALVNA